MSGYTEFSEMMRIYYVNCTFPHEDSYVTEVFIGFNIWPIYLSFVFFGLTLMRWEYFFLLLTISNFADTFLSLAWQSIIHTSERYQPDNCPIPDDQTPSMTSEKIVMLYTVFWSLATITYPTTLIKHSNIVLINFSAILALFTRLYIGFSTPYQMFIGLLFGLGEGFAFAIFFHLLSVYDIDERIRELFGIFHMEITLELFGVYSENNAKTNDKDEHNEELTVDEEEEDLYKTNVTMINSYSENFEDREVW